jgi:hypothetical protein
MSTRAETSGGAATRSIRWSTSASSQADWEGIEMLGFISSHPDHPARLSE